MSLRINTNVPAMMALRNLGNTNTEVAKSIQRLSTGLRINSAADDPAGLIISEGMRAQIKGVGQAIMNSQSGINMAKTADGALSEVGTLLNNIRAVAVHAANSAVVDSAQLQADQNQIKSTLQSIDRIASQTTWGTKRLLDGTAGVTANLTDATDISGMYFGSSFGGQTIANGPITIQRTTAAVQTSLTTNRNFASVAALVPAGSVVVNGYTFTSDGSTDTVQGMVDKINQQSANTGVNASIVVSGPNTNIKLTSSEFGTHFPINYFDATNVLNSVANPPPTIAGVDAVATVTATVQSSTGALSTTSSTFTGGQGATTSGLSLTDSSGNTVRLSATGNASGTLSSATGVGVVTAGSVQFQIGAYAQQSVNFSMPDTRSSQLGTGIIPGQNLSTVDVTTTAGATQGITIIDQAIQQLASMRGQLGSFQSNMLESNVRSLNVANENLTASESDIRDADVAAEMTQYSKMQIFQQSGMAVLAQANSQPQQILKLLQG